MEPLNLALGWAAFALLTLALLTLAATLRHHIARRVPVPSTEGATGHNQHCSVRTCNETVVVSIHAGRAYWPMCMGHGLPFLLEEMVS